MDLRISINKDWVRRITEKYGFLHYVLKWSDGFDLKNTELEEQRIDKWTLGDANPEPVVLQPNRDYSPYWPEDEKQHGRIESMSCTFFGLINVIEALAKRQFNETWDKSERFNAGMVKISRNGYTLNGALDSVRKLHGLVEEAIYPNKIDEVTWNQWIQDPPKEALAKGLYWLSKYDVYFKEIPNTLAGILNGLTFSPVYCAGFAWARNSKGLYYSLRKANHAFAIKKAIGSRLFAGDSYAPFEKELDPSYLIYWPKIIILKKKESLNDKNMTNVKIVRRDNGEFGFYQPCDSEEAFRSLSKNYDLTLPINNSGKIDWDKLKEDGKVNLYK